MLRSDGSIEGFSVDAVSLDTSAFVEQNPGADGTFGLEVTDHETFQTLDVVYTPTRLPGLLPDLATLSPAAAGT